MNELKSCPFCGNDNSEFINYLHNDGNSIMAVCGYCESTGMRCDTEQKAIEAWNTRVNPKED